ncbi:MAG TPA: PQQ-binding-like beta-propeller repeat protein, partial [Stellaceae bacterium]|nr:PQQ-binding-like beta-propeller repeat protein [Stellaceae bacterium]
DVLGQKKAWEVHEPLPVWSGAVVTAGDVVFYGTLDGWFKAADAKTGHVLWQFRAASGIIGQPISYSGADGRQYIAVVAGLGGPLGMIAGNEIDPRDATAAHGMANALPDLPHPAEPGGTLYIFRLP